MIDRTFQLCRGMGPWREKHLWARGIARWADFQRELGSGGPLVSPGVDEAVNGAIGRAQQALAGGDLKALAALVPEREHWRLYRQFSGDAAFLDIEAGQNRDISVLGIMDSKGVASFVAPHDERACVERLNASRLWVTFNGASFDLPILFERFAELKAPEVHIDLRHLTGRAGKRGGLKDIEENLGLNRPAHLKGLGGLDAVTLWSEYQRERRVEVLRLLVEYNLYDVINLKTIVEWCVERLSELNAWDRPRERIFDRGDVLYDVSRLLLALGP